MSNQEETEFEEDVATEVVNSLAAITREIGSVGKDNTNAHHKYSFRSVDQAMAALHDQLVKHSVVLCPCYRDVSLIAAEKGYTCTLMLDLIFTSTKDGSQITTSFPGQGYDVGDKALYKAMAGAYKYAIFQTFCVPVGDKMDVEYYDADVKPSAHEELERFARR